MTTNGLALVSHRVRSEVLQVLDQLTISIDGMAESHDRMRKSPGLFEKLRRYVGQLQSERHGARLRLRVNSILTRQNIDAFEIFCREMAEWGFDELTFNQLGGNDRPEYYPAHRVEPAQWSLFEDRLDDIRAWALGRGMLIRGSPQYLHRIRATTNDQHISIDDCSPGDRFLFVDEMGRVSPCSFTSHCLGISIDDIVDLENPNWARSFRNRLGIVRPAACGDCHATHVFDKFE
jgi:MoaA/NifB/PqqE/SkfB family radical SAM enzyme